MPARVCVLGPVELTDSGGTPVTLAPRARRLLAALTVRVGAVAGVDWLADAVWGDDPPEHAGNAVQTLVSRLRSALRSAGGGPQLLTRPEGYVLVADAAGADAVGFRGLIARARAARQVEDRIAALREALELWRGPAYGLFAEEPFARDEAAALTELRATAVTELAEAELAAGQPGTAQERLTALVAERPYDEHPTLLLMRCLAAMGRTADALAVYADLCRRLRDELGLDPSAEAVAAQRALLRPSSGGSVVGLPLPSDVLGRGADERALAALLAPERTSHRNSVELSTSDVDSSTEIQRGGRNREGGRLVTVLGPGGVGKTTLAARVARLVASDYRDGVIGVELGRLEPDDDAAAALGTALQLPVGSGSSTRRLVDRLRDREVLLVLDNCEHLVAEVAALVDRLLAACRGLTVLATSRVSLRIGDERIYRLEPLAEEHAVELFDRHARRRLRSYAPTVAEHAAVAALCRRLDGLPLAIELAASRVDVISPGELLDRWSWHQSVLRGAGGEARHRSLTALVDWSYDRLSVEAQRVFEAVSVFAGDFSLGDAADLLTRLGDPQDPGWSLTTLVDSSMIVRAPATGRLRLLETLRSYGRQRLAIRADGDTVHEAHARMFADRAVAGRAELYGPGHAREARRQLDSVDELRAGFGWAIDARPELAAQIAGSVAMLVEHTLLGEAVSWADAMLARADLSRDPWACAVAAAGAYFVGDLTRAGSLADEALGLAGKDSLCVAFALVVRGDVALSVGDLDTVLACLGRAHEPTRPMLEFTALLARHYAGQQVDPRAALDLRLALERQGRSVLSAWAEYVEGELLLGADPGRAFALLSVALEQARASHDEYLAGVALVSAASAAHRSDRFEEGRLLFAEAVRHWQVRGDRTHQWTTLRNVVRLLADCDQPADALVLGAALLVPERAAAGFGADLHALTGTVARLSDELGPATELILLGRSFSDSQLVDEALRRLREPDRGSSPLHPIDGSQPSR